MKYLILISFFILVSCSPVRKDYQSRKLTDDESKNMTDKSNYAQESNPQIAKDTITKILPKIYVEVKERDQNRISKDLDAAVFKFNDGLYDEACKEFKVLKETLREYDSLYYETIFYSSECLIVNNEYSLAEEMLSDLLNNENLNINVQERVLLRLGHINCAFEDSENSQFYFKRLHEVNPNSELLPLANCESLK